MPTLNATLLASVNGGAPTTGGITAALGDEVQFSFQSTVGWGSAKLELHAPAGFPTPTGWSSTTVDGHTTHYVLGREAPEPVTLSLWGKYMTRLVVNGGAAVDEATAISVPSPGGLLDLGHREAGQFGGSAEKWAKDMRANWRIVQSGMGSGGGFGEVDPDPDTLLLRGSAGEGKVVRIETSTVRTEEDGDVTLQHGSTGFIRLRSTSACSQPGDVRIDAATGIVYIWSTAASAEVPLVAGTDHWEVNFGVASAQWSGSTRYMHAGMPSLTSTTISGVPVVKAGTANRISVYCHLPGAGTGSYSFTLYKIDTTTGTLTPTSLSVSISPAARYATATGSVSLAVGDVIGVQYDGSGTINSAMQNVMVNVGISA